MNEVVAVLGAGSWGTTLANLLAKKGQTVRLWSFEEDVAGMIRDGHENRRYLQGIPLSANLEATSNLAGAVDGASTIVSVSPSQHVRGILASVVHRIRKDALVVSASKGIETGSLKTMAEVFEEVLPEAVAQRASYLSGPSFALDVAREQPAAVAVASYIPSAARRTQQIFQTDYFRVYTNPDVVGVELGGALKNVMALGAGMVVGLGYGHSTLAALITRGLAEMSRLGAALGANPMTFAGLAGMGDLILTCTGDLSRNRSVGMALGQGKTLAEVLSGMTMVAEGVETAKAAHALARKTGVEMPIVEAVHQVLFEERHPREAVEGLMLREPKSEQWR